MLGKPKVVVYMEKTLTEMKTSETGIIKKFQGGPGFKRNLRTMGIKEDKKIKILARQPFHGPLVLLIEKRETTIGRRMANRIIVETED